MTNRELHGIVITILERQAAIIKDKLRDTRHVAKLEEVKRDLADATVALGELTKNANTAQGVQQGGLFNTEEYSVGKGVRVASY